jgi:hypothetical protein
MRVAILGSSISALEYGHKILDKNPSTQVTVYTEDAEVGFPKTTFSEEVILRDVLHSIPDNWYSSIPTGIDREVPSTTAAFWLSKTMAIRLTCRGARFLLRTRIVDIDEDRCEISFRGGGLVGSGVDSYDVLSDFRGTRAMKPLDGSFRRTIRE